MQPLESSRHTQWLPLPVSEERKRNSAQWNLQPFGCPCCWSLCCLWSAWWQANSCTESSSQTLCCLHLLLWWIQSTAQTHSASVKDKAGDLQCFLHTSGPLQTQTAQHTLLSSCALHSLSCDTAQPNAPMGQRTLGCGRRNLCSTRTEGLNLHPQLIIL